MLDVRTRAHFFTEVSDGIHGNAFAVFVAEKRARSGVFGVVEAHLFNRNGKVARDLFVHQIFDFLHFFFRQCTRKRKIEAEAFGRNIRTLLRDFRPEHPFERFVQQVRRRMIFRRNLRMIAETAFKSAGAQRTRFFLMLFFLFFERIDIDRHTVFAAELFGQFDRKTERIVESESDAARNRFMRIF